jgi:quercetin dioxygenase-like cupin family protein
MAIQSNRLRRLLILAAVAALARAAATHAEDGNDTDKMITVNPQAMKFTPIPDMPACATAAILRGNPRTGSAWVLLKLASGCRVPWHWHTANESLLVISGRGTLEMKDARSLEFAAGAYASLPSRHQHQARCTRSCLLFNAADAAFDIHYVDANGDDISLEKAMRPPVRAKKK